ncbi:MAG: PEP-CTERM sorting domain-containing protein [Gallionella sp.]
MKRVKTLTAAIFLLGQALSGAAFAATVTLSGSTVDFILDDTMLGPFGPASVFGDILYFTPIDFAARSLNGGGYSLTNETMNIKVSAHAGWEFSSMDLTEKGDYLLLGSGSTADISGQMRVFDVAKPLVDVTASLQPGSPFNQMGLPTHNWTALASTDLSAWNTTRMLNVTVENLLLASTGVPSSVAFVEKKFVGLTAVMAPVPEADTYAMMLAGLGLVGLTVMRRRAKFK